MINYIKNMTPVQQVLCLIAFNSALAGSAAQLGELFGTVISHYIITIATFANTLISAIIVPMTGQSAQILNVRAMAGVENIDINEKANPVLAKIAMDANESKVTVIPAAQAQVAATAKAG